MNSVDFEFLGETLTACPSGALYLPIRSNIPEVSKHAFKVVDDTFAERAHKAGGGIFRPLRAAPLPRQ